MAIGLAWYGLLQPWHCIVTKDISRAIPVLILSPVSLAGSASLRAYTMGPRQGFVHLVRSNALTALVARRYVQIRCVHTCVAWTFVEPLRSSTEGFCTSFLGEERWLFSVMIAMIRPLGRNRRIYLNRRDGEGASACAYS